MTESASLSSERARIWRELSGVANVLKWSGAKGGLADKIGTKCEFLRLGRYVSSLIAQYPCEL